MSDEVNRFPSAGPGRWLRHEVADEGARMTEPIVRSWGCQDSSGLAVRLVRRDEELTITISAPLGSLDLEAFAPAAGDKAPSADGASG